MDSQGKGAQGRVLVARRLASAIAPIASRLVELGTEYSSSLRSMDTGVRTIISQATAKSPLEGEARQSVCDFFQETRSLTSTSRNSIIYLAKLAESAKSMEGLSRDLRPPLRTLGTGINMFIDGHSIMEAWTELIDRTGIDCSAEGNPAS